MQDTHAATIVFDFDHTLTTWDSSARFFRWLLRRGLWRLVLLIAVLPVLAPLLLVRRWRKRSVCFAVWLATLGRSSGQIAALARLHVAELLAAGETLILADAIAQVQWHLQQQQRVVVATGSLQVLAREFLDRGGLAGLPLVGSTLKPHLRGMIADAHCYGARKIDMLRERGYPPPWTLSYTDHECDLPVIAHSDRFVLVNPRPTAIRAVSDRLGSPPNILRWR